VTETDYFAPGQWNALCHICGAKKKSGDLVKHWQGFYCCPHHPGITRHPQDFVRGIPDNQAAPWTQPAPADRFVDLCSPNEQTAIPRRAGPGCVKPGYLAPGYDLTFALED